MPARERAMAGAERLMPRRMLRARRRRMMRTAGGATSGSRVTRVGQGATASEGREREREGWSASKAVAAAAASCSDLCTACARPASSSLADEVEIVERALPK